MTARRRKKRPVIVVGYDGSAASSRAVDVAVERARRIRGRLVIVHADGDGHRSRSLLDGLLLEGHDRLSDLEYETLALSGSPATAIAETADARDG
jgi:nucleotide-binding universal stress UspA family protein